MLLKTYLLFFEIFEHFLKIDIEKLRQFFLNEIVRLGDFQNLATHVFPPPLDICQNFNFLPEIFKSQHHSFLHFITKVKKDFFHLKK
jgi:hypothetical protein